MAAEVSKVEGLTVDAQGLAEILKNNPCAGAILLAAAKMDDDYKKNLLPSDFADWDSVSKCFGASISSKDYSKLIGYDLVDLPPFLKYALVNIVKSAQS